MSLPHTLLHRPQEGSNLRLEGHDAGGDIVDPCRRRFRSGRVALVRGAPEVLVVTALFCLELGQLAPEPEELELTAGARTNDAAVRGRAW